MQIKEFSGKFLALASIENFAGSWGTRSFFSGDFQTHETMEMARTMLKGLTP